jgi:hypothetical protein
MILVLDIFDFDDIFVRPLRYPKSFVLILENPKDSLFCQQGIYHLYQNAR